MKKKIFILTAALVCAGMTQASVIMDETFNYDVDSLQAETTSWTHSGTITTGNGRLIEATPLSYTNAGGEYILSGVGKKINNNYTAGSNYISYKTFTKVTSGVIYLSYLYQGNGDQGQSNSEILGLATKDSNSSLKAWAGKQADQTKNPYRLGITRASTAGADIQWADNNTVDKANVNLIVLKYDFATGKASLFLNPTIGSAVEETPIADDSIGTAPTSLGFLMFKHNGKSVANFFVSGVRISTTWAEAVAKKVTGLPALTTPVVGVASAVKAEEFTANWTPVANATGYTVKVYQGSDFLASYPAAGQATNSLNIIGLWPLTEYTYTVTAEGDGATANDSEESVKSAAFTTADALANINTDFGNEEIWGAPITAPTTIRINGFDLNAAFVEASTTRGYRGEYHTNRIKLDKQQNDGMLTFPVVKSMEQIEIHVSVGTAEKAISLQELNTETNTWNTLGTYTMYQKADTILLIALSRPSPTKLRIINADNSGKYIWQIVTRTTHPSALSIPEVAAATNITAEGFTANWTAVENATGYNVLVYDTVSYKKTVSVVGQATTNIAVSELLPETEYSYKVVAVGDDVNYLTSFLSAGITVTTIKDPTALLSTENVLKLWNEGTKISVSENGNLQVYNLAGTCVHSADIVKSVDLQISEGLYIVRFTSVNGKQLVQKISIK